MVKLATQVTVQLTATRLIGFDANRTSLVIRNHETVAARTVFIDTDAQVTVAEGLPILARGGAISLSDVTGDDPTLAYYAIATAGTADVRLFVGKSTLLQRLVLFLKQALGLV